ncbi:hypothetical protein EI94DRAFT_775871 [Lactarius quietus]|nr:hypothetical protein EI94DRAFT_775871 [Lactarius quietus]
MYQFTFHLGMHIRCTNGAPIVDKLDHLPPLPLLVEYAYTMTKQDELGIYRALRLNDRVREISLFLPPSLLQQFLVLLEEHFPRLERLYAMPTSYNFTTFTLPKGFLAPNLRHLTLPGISPSKGMWFLTSTVSLTTLVLFRIQEFQASSDFRPSLLVARLGSLPQLKELIIWFSIPMPSESQPLGEQGTPVTLPSLKTLEFEGFSTYLESLIAQIRVPLLEQLKITLFKQIAFALPHLSHLLNTTEKFKLPAAEVHFSHYHPFNSISIIFTHHMHHSPQQPNGGEAFCLSMRCELDRVERFMLKYSDGTRTYTRLEDLEIDATTWHELLRSFIGVRNLHVSEGVLNELSRALQVNEVGLEPEFLHHLQTLEIDPPGQVSDHLFASFLNARRIAGRPVQFPPQQEFSTNGSALIKTTEMKVKNQT